MSDIQHIKHYDIDLVKWDKTILSSQYPLVFAQSFYLNATCPDWDALVLGDYEAVFPLTQKTKFRIPYLHQPSFTPQLGLFGQFNLALEQKVYDHLKLQYKLVEIEMNASNHLETKHHTKKTTFIIDYKKEFKQNQNTKRNISKALENNLKFEVIPETEILELSKTYLDPFLSKKLHLSDNSIKLFNDLLRSGISHKTLYSFRVVDVQNNLKAIAHFISNGKHTVYLKGTNFDKSENSGSMHLLTSSAIQFFENRSDFFDFGGGSKESLATFYKGFGATPLDYKFLTINNLPWLIKLLKNKK
jgi:hypothetical protein